VTRPSTHRKRVGALNVLVVDDSAVVRMAMPSVLAKDRHLKVEVAADPLIAMQKMRRFRPDVIVLDLEMPRMDGMTFLRKLMREDPIPVVVCSALGGPGTEAGLRALEEGAVDIIAKPRLGVREFLEESAVLLIDAVRAAAVARIGRQRPRTPRLIEPRLSADAVLPVRPTAGLKVTTDKIVAIGASTGGTEALQHILQSMPPDCPGIVVVQHMPEFFTRAFAERLDSICPIEVREAASGDRVVGGQALIAPGNRHTLLKRSGASYIVDVVDGPLVSRHRPSVDVLFRSTAQSAGPSAVGIIMTGMGNDGADGLLEMRNAGAATIAQDEASSVVFGMPKEAIARGAVEDVVSLAQIPAAILRRARQPAASTAGRPKKP
jgi:two-component system, chemotaxis family, protein-glutamate methylesterase/glutaminase